MGITCTAFSESLARCTSFLPMSEWGSYEGRPSGSSNDLGAAFSAAAAAGRRCSSDIVEALDDRNILVTDADLYWGKEKNSPPILVPPRVGSEEIRRLFDARREGIRGETGWTLSSAIQGCQRELVISRHGRGRGDRDPRSRHDPRD
ncbi:hypothetical protein GW17_00006185 [Ensete ventricosum]|nr:hypothetical protein GW17_00006185 [Ensete ventricosum]